MKKHFWAKSWFWLMLITINLSIISIIFLFKFCDFLSICKSEYFWSAISATATSVSVIIAVVTYLHNEKTRKKQATYDAFRQFKINVFDLENEIANYEIKSILENHENQNNNSEWIIIKKYLIQIEQIATCVNSNIFDVDTVYNMGGPFLINQYNRLKPIIEHKRAEEKRDGVYIEFEYMVKSLQKKDRSVRNNDGL